jgi:hypothetical protein
MEAKTKRRVKSGKEYEYLFPRPLGKDVVIMKNADVFDTVQFIQQQVPQTTWQTKKFATFIQGRTLEETCAKLWQFTYDHIPYKRDEFGIEQIRSPRRAWFDRNRVTINDKGQPESGVDCDCYTVFLSSTLMNLGIPHKYRITKYIKRDLSTPRWQHIYIVIPKDGSLDDELTNREDYIVMDCVKDEYDEEEPYLQYKDFNAMKLEFLDDIEREETAREDEYEYVIPQGVDIQDLVGIYDEEELGKIGSWLKKATKNVGKAVKVAVKPVAKVAKAVAKPVAKVAKAVAKPVGKALKKVGDAAGKVIRAVNRFANPATILLRNGILLSMKANLMNVAKRMRYAYLPEAEAQRKGMNLSELAKLRKIKDKAETIYWQTGGKKNNLMKAILKGRGNKDKQVAMAGLTGIQEYDTDEYEILYGTPGFGQLGEPASGAAIAAAASVLASLAASLKQIKGLFPGKSAQEAEMQNDSDPGAQAAAYTEVITEEEQSVHDESDVELAPETIVQQAVQSAPVIQQYQPTVMPQAQHNLTVQQMPQVQQQQQVAPLPDESGRRADPTTTAVQVTTPGVEQTGVFSKAGAWIKKNPVPTTLIAAGIGTGIYLYVKNKNKEGDSSKKRKTSQQGLSGLPQRKKRGRKGKVNKNRKKKKAVKYQAVTIR